MPNATVALDRASADISLSRAAREDLERAANEAARRDADESNPVDVLRAVLANRGSLAVNTLRSLGADPAAVAAALPADGVATPLPLRQLLVNANREAQVLGHYSVDSIHLLLALMYSDSPATAAALQKAGLTMYDLRRHLQTGVRSDTPASGPKPASARPPDRALRRRPLPQLRGALRNKWWDSLVSLACPLGTLLCGLLFAAVIVVSYRLGLIRSDNMAFFEALAVLGFVEMYAFVLNFVPVPPLDGFGIIRPWLPYSIQSAAAQLGTFALIIVFAAIWYVPAINLFFVHSASTLATLFGIDPYLIYFGQQHFRLQ